MKIEGKNVGSVLHHINQKRGINMEKEKLEKCADFLTEEECKVLKEVCHDFASTSKKEEWKVLIPKIRDLSYLYVYENEKKETILIPTFKGITQDNWRLVVSCMKLRHNIFYLNDNPGLYDATPEIFFENLKKLLHKYFSEELGKTVLYYYGFIDGREHTFKETGEYLEMSKQTIRMRMNDFWRKARRNKEFVRLVRHSPEWYEKNKYTLEAEQLEMKTRSYFAACDWASVKLLNLPEDTAEILEEKELRIFGEIIYETEKFQSLPEMHKAKAKQALKAFFREMVEKTI